MAELELVVAGWLIAGRKIDVDVHTCEECIITALAAPAASFTGPTCPRGSGPPGRLH